MVIFAHQSDEDLLMQCVEAINDPFYPSTSEVFHKLFGCFTKHSVNYIMRSINVCTVLGLLAATSVAFEYFPKFSEECDNWAERDGECINNPSFMWSKCLRSCINLSADDNDRCEAWADEGECTNNPNYIQLHCPKSCKLAIAWSPWVRSTLGIEEAPFYVPEGQAGIQGEPCAGYPVDTFSAAQIMHMRLQRLFAGEYKSIVGFSFASPTEYLGMLGFAEAVLYCLRLYETVLQAALRKADAATEADITQQVVLNKERIEFIVSEVGKGYDSDPLMRALPGWMSLLADSSFAALYTVAQIHHSTPDTFNYCDASHHSPQLPELVPYFAGPEVAQQTGEGAPAPADFALQNGVRMPSVGLGTWQLEGDHCYDVVLAAITAGYRSIDTAQAYRNEAEVGRAIKAAIDKKLVSRKDLFVATKLSDPADAGYSKVKQLIQRQLRDLQVSYLDLYMLHSPLGEPQLQQDTWRALEELLHSGVLRAIGVSNFDSAELEALSKTATVKPMVVQNKVDVYHVGKQLDNRGDPIVKYTKENNILLVAYSTFSAYPFVMQATEDPVVRWVARSRGLTTGQVLLKWALQKGFAIIPRSSHIDRLKENLQAQVTTPLRKEDIKLLDTLQYLVSSPVSVPEAI